MYCPSCGTLNEPKANFCTKCGHHIASAQIGQPNKTNITTSNAANAVIVVGVKGWLLFLCVALTIIGPAVTLYSVGSSFGQMSSSFQNLPDLKLAVMVESIVNLAMSAFGAYAGYLLWRIKPKAVMTAKIYFLLFGTFSLLSPSLFLELANLPTEVEKTIEDALIKQATRGLLSSIIWLTYLFKSKRVKMTYC